MEKFCEYLKDGFCAYNINFRCPYTKKDITKFPFGRIVISNMPGSAFDEGICKNFIATEEICKYFQQFEIKKEGIMEKFCSYLNKDRSCSAKTNLTTIFYCPYIEKNIHVTVYGTKIISNGPGSALWDYACKDWDPTEDKDKRHYKYRFLSWNTKEHKDIEKSIHYKEQTFCCCKSCTHSIIEETQLCCGKVFGIFSEVKFPVEYNGICDYYKEVD